MGDRFFDRATGCVTLLCLCLAAVPAVGGENGLIDFSGAPIVTGENAADLEMLAARELQRYLKHVSPKTSPIVTAAPEAGPYILLGAPQRHAAIAALAAAGAVRGEQGSPRR